MKDENKIVLVAKQFGLTENKIEPLMQTFAKYFDEAKVLAEKAKSIVVTDESQVILMSKARASRLDLKFIRVEVEKTRKELKEESLREGRAIEGVANIIKALIVPVEKHLEKQEKFVENIENRRREKIYQERIDKLTPCVEDVNVYNIREMSDAGFEELLKSSRLAIQVQKEAEEKVEKERIAKEKEEAEERERMRVENVKLHKEAEEREKRIAKEKEEQEKVLNEEREKREAVEVKLRADKEKGEAEERKRREIEEARIELEKEAERKALLAPDKEKLNGVAMEIDNFKLPAVESQEAGEILFQTRKQLTQISNYLREKAKTI